MECSVYSSVALPFSKKQIQKNVESVLISLKQKDAILSLHIIGDKKMTKLNFEHRGKNKPTDVLSFAIQEGERFPGSNDWGDIFICLPQVKRQAKEYHISWQEEFYRMLTHGILHLFGYDHMKERDAKRMFSLQEKFLNQMYEH